MNKRNNKFRYQVASCWLFILTLFGIISVFLHALFLGGVTADTCPPNPSPCVRRMYPHKTHLVFGGPQKLSATLAFCTVPPIVYNNIHTCPSLSELHLTNLHSSVLKQMSPYCRNTKCQSVASIR